LYTVDDIKARIAKLGTKAEVDKRVFGKYVTPDGVVYSAFNREVNIVEAKPVPKGWKFYAGVDIGGGGSSHPSAISIVAVDPECKQGRCVRLWRGDGAVTTSEDVLKKYLGMTVDLDITTAYYDWSNKDFHTIATRAGYSFAKAEKGHDIGINLLNSLFKNRMLAIEDSKEAQELAQELETLSAEDIKGQNKRWAKDDLIDGLRYCVTGIPWSFEHITLEFEEPPKPVRVVLDERLEAIEEAENMLKKDEMDEEIAMWNELYEG
jgi:hypothetical protein